VCGGSIISKVIVIGSGLIGVTTAYFLSHRGHEVIVVDRQDGPGKETSFANGALLTPSMAEPWNAPGSWRVLLASLGRSDAAMQLRLRSLPALMGWGVRFLRNSRTATFERNALSNLRLSLASLEVMQALREQTNIEYGRASRGSLRIFRDPASLARASTAANRVVSEGLSFRQLSRGEVIELEPALMPIANQLTGAIHYGIDETGDAYQFCVALAACCRERGVEFRFRTEVSALEARSGRVIAVVSQRERLVADQYVVAAGSYSAPLLRSVGVNVPIQPAKGYSVTIDRNHARPSLLIPVVDDQLHAVIVPLGGTVRVAGTAEFAGYDRRANPHRIRNLLGLLQRVLPQAQFDRTKAVSWSGLRAMSADGVPIIGRTAISNLFVNSGHGHLGWTMAAGSARLLMELTSGDATFIDPAPFDLARFNSARVEVNSGAALRG
jgi:D-amino-acid dehydrogenase